MFGLSKREMEAKFRRSELIIMAWRSQEVSASLKMKTDGTDQPPVGKKRKTYSDAQVPRNLPDKFYNKDGEVDLRQVTGAEAYKYMMSQGVKLPIFGRG
jgi:hypothetical protein